MNWTGRNDKANFKQLTNVIRVIAGNNYTHNMYFNAMFFKFSIFLAAARRSPKGGHITQTEVENVIKVWLRTAGDRDGGREKRRSKR